MTADDPTDDRHDISLDSPSDAFPQHVFDALGVPPRIHDERIGGSVLVVEKHPPNGPVTLITAGASRIPVDAGLPVELAVEVPDGQQGAALVALRIVCDDMASHRRTPPVGTPWRNGTPFLSGTEISAIVATDSRWGPSFDEIVDRHGTVVGRVRTLRLLTDAEAGVVADRGWDALVTESGGIDRLLDVERQGQVAEPPRAVIATKLHEQYPPRWLTLSRGLFESVTGAESPEYMDDADNHEILSLDTYLARFPWIERFVRSAVDGQTARFDDASGDWTPE